MAGQTESTHAALVLKVGEISAIVTRLEDSQKEMLAVQGETVLAVGIMTAILKEASKGRALNCEARISMLEKNTNGCKELRVGPRVDAVEKRQDKMLWGGLMVVVVTIFTAIIKAVGK